MYIVSADSEFAKEKVGSLGAESTYYVTEMCVVLELLK